MLSVEPIAIMMRKDDPAFKKAVDDSIKAMIKSGELAKLYDKWFMQPIPPGNTKVGLPLSRRDQGGLGQPERQADGRLREEVIRRKRENASGKPRRRREFAQARQRGAEPLASRLFHGVAAAARTSRGAV